MNADHIDSIKKLFELDVTFKIPEYQRAYAWEVVQFKQFIEDLTDSVGYRYYFGHFLFEKNQGANLFIIDGQQRLTTCIIFISACLEILQHKIQSNTFSKIELNELNSLVEALSNRYLICRQSGLQKFKVVDYDNNFFSNVVILHKANSPVNEPVTNSQVAIKNAFDYFKSQLVKAETNQIVEWIRQLESASITFYMVADKLQANQIFTFQNDRGKKLTNLEVLKAHFILQIYKASKNLDHVEHIDRAFADISKEISQIKTIDEDSVLNFYWRAVGPKGYNSENTVVEVKEWIKTLNNLEKVDKILAFVDELVASFRFVRDFNSDNTPETRYLRYLGNMALSYPVLIRAFLSDVKTETRSRLYKMMENLTLRWLIRGGRAEISSRIQTTLMQASDDFSFNEKIDYVKSQLNSEPRWSYWTDDVLRSHLESKSFFQNRVDNYVLWRYEESFNDKNYPNTPYDFKDFINNESIEHIAPQTKPEANDDNGYGTDVYEDKINGETINWVNSLGNLMLLAGSQNSQLGNRPLAVKVEVYKNSALQHQREVADLIESESKNGNLPIIWDKAAIMNRQDKIVRFAMSCWDIKTI